ncbi:olfactory receptor 11A1-like [Tiliqua scincoides]|uniref:olfactory receptor 11A1-like n=1 Tax=Tiliqua scincoides TaxID=71010 RepID=UPI0034632151
MDLIKNNLESTSLVQQADEEEEKNHQGNQTLLTEFILLGFGDLQELKSLLFLLFLLIYILTMAGNILIIALVVTDGHLHTPMYFLLGNLSFLEICCTSNILPKVLASFASGDKTISVWGCLIQFYVFCSLAVTECCLLAVMSLDRYLAICKPLHYAMIMKDKVCLSLAAGSWVSGFSSMYVMLYLVSTLTFCGPNEIDHFFCDLSPLLQITCSETYIIEWTTLVFSSLSTFPPFLLTLTSYVFVISTILRIPSTAGRKKAFSTCSSHLIVVTMFYGILIIVYVLPKHKMPRALHKVLYVLYTACTPLVNPLIYSLRNKEIKDALKKSVQRVLYFIRLQQAQCRASRVE